MQCCFMDVSGISTPLPRKSYHHSEVTLTALVFSFDAVWHQFGSLGKFSSRVVACHPAQGAYPPLWVAKVPPKNANTGI